MVVQEHGTHVVLTSATGLESRLWPGASSPGLPVSPGGFLQDGIIHRKICHNLLQPAGSAGNIGTSLTNDHPVGYLYDPSKDHELVSRPWPWRTPIKLDPDASNGTVECHTCHDLHNDQFKKFLRVDNMNAVLCTVCHAKTGWGDGNS